jgi:hypothetical protein
MSTDHRSIKFGHILMFTGHSSISTGHTLHVTGIRVHKSRVTNSIDRSHMISFFDLSYWNQSQIQLSHISIKIDHGSMPISPKPI